MRCKGRWLTIAQLAERAGLAASTIYGYRARKRVSAPPECRADPISARPLICERHADEWIAREPVDGRSRTRRAHP